MEKEKIEELNVKEKKELSVFEKLEEMGVSESEIIEESLDSSSDWNSYFSSNINSYKSNRNFCINEQWDSRERTELNHLFKPVLSVNKTYDSVKKIIGEQRKNRPDLIVRSLNGLASQQEINLREDIVRSISYHSSNNIVFQNAFEMALTGGFGAFQVLIDYEPMSFNKCIKYSLIQDMQRTVFDPVAEMPHKGDGNFCSNVFFLSKKEFEATYGIENPVSYSDTYNNSQIFPIQKNQVGICEYFHKKWFPVKLFLLSNGMSVTEEKWNKLEIEYAKTLELAKSAKVVGDFMIEQIPYIVSERITQDYKIYQYRLLKDKVIECAQFPSKHLPIIFVDGNSHFINGQQFTRSYIRDSIDIQKSMNYVFVELITEVKNRRREQWIGTPDNVVGNDLVWQKPELQQGILLAKADPNTGQLPSKIPTSELPMSLLQLYQRLNLDLREILGYSESTGEFESRDISGSAKRERKIEASMSCYVYMDNLNQAIQQSGRIILDLIPYIYGGKERIIHLTKKDGNSEMAILNKKNPDGSIENEILGGEYDIEIDAGPSFAVQKQAAIELFTQAMQANPQVFNLVADLWAKNMDVQFMPQIVERFKTMVPPQILAQEEGKPMPPPQPNPEMIMQQHQIMMDQEDLRQREQEINIKEKQLELEKEKHLVQLAKDKNNFVLNMMQIEEKAKDNHLNKDVEMKKALLQYHSDMRKLRNDLDKEVKY